MNLELINKTSMIKIRVTPQEKTEWIKRAQQRNLTLTELIKLALSEKSVANLPQIDYSIINALTKIGHELETLSQQPPAPIQSQLKLVQQLESTHLLLQNIYFHLLGITTLKK